MELELTSTATIKSIRFGSKEIALSFMEKSGLVWVENNGAYYADYRHREDLLHSFKAQLKIKKID